MHENYQNCGYYSREGLIRGNTVYKITDNYDITRIHDSF